MDLSQESPIPEVFVLWHPKFQLGEYLARRIIAWLRPGNGLGPEVFYRCLSAPEAPADGLPLPLPGEMRSSANAPVKAKQNVSNLQVVLPLIDEHMVSDQAWRYWIASLAGPSQHPQRVLMPVALDATAYNMPPALRELNYLRPSGLPIAETSGPAFETVARSLLKQVTEAMCRLILPRPGRRTAPAPPAAASESLPKVTVFLSHAKQDGTIPARRIRDYIYSQTQLTAFYDENDIAFGAVFERIIKDDLDSPDTAALIAIRSARYASRPWCRRELSMFRRPRQEGPSAGGAERWRLYPTLVVEAMDGSQLSPGIAELGNSTVIRWNDTDENLEELIITTIIRDAMLASFHSALGASIPSTASQIIISWLPDPTTLLHIPSIRSQRECDVLYPGRGLSGLELDILAEFFPSITFRSFEEVLS